MENKKTKRIRGVILTTIGLKRLQAAIELAEVKENNGERFTQEELSERMKVSTKTISRLWVSYYWARSADFEILLQCL
ncbi:MAG: hypothetical protein KatS3mg066_1669 [Fischerella sp.]|nr:MAG: hypothetical protein KatS3mg066_1669 [Fischerella sp.]